MELPVHTETDREIIRDDKGRWVPGGAPPAFRPKSTIGGRALALKTLDVMLGKERNQVNLMNALQAHFDADPVRFFKQIIMPLLPTEVKMKLGEEGAITWLSLSTTPRIQGNNPSTTPAIDVSGSSVAEGAGERPSA